MKKTMKLGLCMGSVALASAMIMSGCEKKADLLEKPIERQEFNMGTYSKISIYDKDKEKAMDAAFARITDLESQIEVNEEGISELDQVNDNAGIKPTKVGKDVLTLVTEAKKDADETKGEYNPAIGPITQLWHIGFPDAKKPSESEIKPLLDKLDYKKIEIDQETDTIFLKDKGMSLDLGGIAKAFIAQQAMEVLKKDGVTTAVLDFGGHIFTMGENPKSKDGKWNVSIQNPSLNASTGDDANDKIVGTITGNEKAMITTSMYERYLMVGDKMYSHLMDSKTGQPYDNGLLSVTVIGDDIVNVDALSNALYDMGLDKGMEYAKKHSNEVQAVFLTKDKKVYLTDGLKEMYKQNDKSSFKLQK